VELLLTLAFLRLTLPCPLPHLANSERGALGSTEEERTMDVKEELLKLAYKKLDETARLLKAADEELLALEAEELAVKVDLAEAALHPLLR
jgi:hypothetical protein